MSGVVGRGGYLAQTTARLRTAGAIMLLLGLLIFAIAMRYR